MKTIRPLIFLGMALVGNAAVSAATIDFEGFGPTNAPLTEGTPLVAASDQGVTVQFETIDDSGGLHTPFIAQTGGDRVAFQSVLSDDTPVLDDGSRYLLGGSFSLTDGIRQTHDYKLTFSQPVENLSLDIYDFRGDGPHLLANLGSDFLTLRTYDEVGNPLGSDSFTLGQTRPIDGNVLTLSVAETGIHSALIDFSSIEGGTAIDNIRFTPVVVPEPSSIGLLLWVCLIAMRGSRLR